MPPRARNVAHEFFKRSCALFERSHDDEWRLSLSGGDVQGGVNGAHDDLEIRKVVGLLEVVKNAGVVATE